MLAGANNSRNRNGRRQYQHKVKANSFIFGLVIIETNHTEFDSITHMVAQTGIEPVTPPSSGECSTS